MRLLLTLVSLAVGIVLAQSQPYQQNNYYNGPPPSYQQQQNQYYQQQPPYNQQYNGGNNNYNYNNNNNYNNYNKNYYKSTNKCAPVKLGCATIDIGISTRPNYESGDFTFYKPYYFFSPNMTNHLCADFCGANFFDYSLTNNASECYCGQILSFTNSTTGCSVGCSGNSMEKCGGSSSGTTLTMTLYTTPFHCINNQLSFASKMYPKKCQSRVIQCSSGTDEYFDAQSESQISTGAPDMNNEVCAAYCSVASVKETFYHAQTTGFTLSATRDGNTCACLYTPGTPQDSSNCNVTCVGNSKEFCGGNFTIAGNNYWTVSTTQIGCNLYDALYSKKNYMGSSSSSRSSFFYRP